MKKREPPFFEVSLVIGMLALLFMLFLLAAGLIHRRELLWVPFGAGCVIVCLVITNIVHDRRRDD